MMELLKEILDIIIYGGGETVATAIAWFIPMIAGAGLSLVKSVEEKNQYERDVVLAAKTQQYSPWTGLTAGPVQRPQSGFMSAMQGGIAGLGMGQSAFGKGIGVDQLGATQAASWNPSEQLGKTDITGAAQGFGPSPSRWAPPFNPTMMS